jgi:hypothetical protein
MKMERGRKRCDKGNRKIERRGERERKEKYVCIYIKIR